METIFGFICGAGLLIFVLCLAAVRQWWQDADKIESLKERLEIRDGEVEAITSRLHGYKDEISKLKKKKRGVKK